MIRRQIGISVFVIMSILDQSRHSLVASSSTPPERIILFTRRNKYQGRSKQASLISSRPKYFPSCIHCNNIGALKFNLLIFTKIQVYRGDFPLLTQTTARSFYQRDSGRFSVGQRFSFSAGIGLHVLWWCLHLRSVTDLVATAIAMKGGQWVPLIDAVDHPSSVVETQCIAFV